MKIVTRLTLLFILVVGFNTSIKSQAAIVYDPTSYAESVKQGVQTEAVVANTGEMITLLTDVQTEIKKAEELLTKINAGLEMVIWTKQIYNRQVNLIDMQHRLTVRTTKMKNMSPEELLRFTNQLLTLCKSADALIGTVKDLITPGKWSMNDSERMNSLKDLDKAMSFQQTIMKIQYLELQSINTEREVNKTIKMAY